VHSSSEEELQLSPHEQSLSKGPLWVLALLPSSSCEGCWG